MYFSYPSGNNHRRRLLSKVSLFLRSLLDHFLRPVNPPELKLPILSELSFPKSLLHLRYLRSQNPLIFEESMSSGKIFCREEFFMKAPKTLCPRRPILPVPSERARPAVPVSTIPSNITGARTFFRELSTIHSPGRLQFLPTCISIWMCEST